MTIIEAVVLGVVQGVTEFLPISSSGHLVIFQHLFRLKEPVVAFDISVHIGTLIAVITFFFHDIKEIIKAFIRVSILLLKTKTSRSISMKDLYARWLILIIAGSIPTAVLGLAFHKIVERIFSSVFFVGIALIITGLILWLSRNSKRPEKNIDSFSIKDAVIIGLAQGIAVLPGISRSGSTIAAGLFLGIERETAARFSFLLSIPAILGATLLMVKDALQDPLFNLETALTGAFISCIVGYLFLRFLVFIVKKGKLHFFSVYCWLLGLTALFI
jgi:undecaprenyl-diphosphatase